MAESQQPSVLGLDPNLAVKTFFQDPNWLYKCCVGGVVNASSFILFFLATDMPLLILFCFCLWAINTGFVLRVLRQRIIDPQGAIPNWDDWSDLFVSGMSWIAITTGVGVLFSTLSGLYIMLATALGAVVDYADSYVYLMTASFVFIILVGLLINMVICATMANFAQEENMTSGFAFGKVMARISKRPKDFICAWLLGLGIQGISLVVLCGTVIGLLFLPPLMFAANLISAAIMAQAWSSSDDRTGVVEAADASQKADQLSS